MKSMKFLAVAGAVALLGTAGFTSCKQNNTPDNPYTPENYKGDVVKTELTIVIPGQKEKAVRYMPGTSTQKAGNFLGMDEIILMPYITAVTNDKSAAVGTADTRLGDVIALESISSGVDTLSKPGTTTPNRKVYTDLTLPLGTNHFLFYAHGKGPHNQSDSEYSVENNFTYGRLTAANTAETTPANITFSPKVIYSSNETPNKAALLADYLTHISKASDGTELWKNGGKTYNAAYKALYDSLLLMTAGSSASVCVAVQDLYSTVNDRFGTNAELKAAILDSILNYMKGSSSAITNSVDGEGKITFDDAFLNYPQNIHLPDGAAAIAWSTSNLKFEVTSTAAWKANNTTTSASLTVSNINKYVYPVAIYYYANSGLKTSTSKQSDKYKNYDYWDALLAGLYGGTKNIYVANDTRSVAIADSIQYGVANVETCVKASAAKLNDAAGNSIDVTNLKMTAVLVGNQGPVKYNFSPDALGDFIIYDSIMESPAASLPYATSTYTTPNTTLVLETPANNNVLMAVEFLNDDKDFVGVDGRIIPKGTKFYLVAELDAASVTESELDNKIFKQDYTTFVKLTLTNLNKAYNVIPDLRSSKMEVGFAVDLSWRSGHVFDITF